ncbi:MAG: DUF5615 family PIN-like protein [Acidobacteriota bacterium]
MRILVDENIPRMTVTHLTVSGHDVLDIRALLRQGLQDTDLWKIAIQQDRLLITTDRGFTQHRNAVHGGILIVRLRQPNRFRIHSAVIVGMNRFRQDEWPGLLVVIRDTTLSASRSEGTR